MTAPASPDGAAARTQKGIPSRPRHRTPRFTEHDSPQVLLAEIERLTGCLLRANAGFEKHERLYLMADLALDDTLALCESPTADDLAEQVRAVITRFRNQIADPAADHSSPA